MRCLTRPRTPIRDEVLLLFATCCFSSCSAPERITQGHSPSGRPCPRCLHPGAPAQLSGAGTSLACGQVPPWWLGTQAGQHSSSPVRQQDHLSHPSAWLPMPILVVRQPLNLGVPSQQQQDAACVCPVLSCVQLHPVLRLSP